MLCCTKSAIFYLISQSVVLWDDHSPVLKELAVYFLLCHLEVMWMIVVAGLLLLCSICYGLYRDYMIHSYYLYPCPIHMVLP
jgi:hypothetical protein